MKIINRKIRICLVGCGKISIRHINAIKNLANDFDLVGICDQNKIYKKYNLL